jgi:hypothetical protein
MIIEMLLVLASQASHTVPSPPAPAAAHDTYTTCFFRELSRLEGRDVAVSPEPFTMRHASTALRRCQDAKAELSASIGRELAADPAFSDRRLREVELENRVMRTELVLLLLIRAKAR